MTGGKYTLNEWMDGWRGRRRRLFFNEGIGPIWGERQMT
jgi:hypothetical protein